MSRVALGHHWVASYRGGEKVFEKMIEAFPNADLYSLIRVPGIDVPGLRRKAVQTTFLNRLPKISKLYPYLLPFHPFALSWLKIPGDIDLFISSDASLFKTVSLPRSAKHVCYCHSPPRYLWELGDAYSQGNPVKRLLMNAFTPALRRVDYRAAQRVDHFISNSNFVAQRIRDHYQRESTVIYPPVEVDAFDHRDERDDFYLVVSEMTAYKRIDLAVATMKQLNRRLVVIGDGTERDYIESLAGPNTEFLGRVSFDTIREKMGSARALLFPGIEDFGITPVEAQAAGCPVIAYRGGGALETVVDNVTGVFFNEQTPESLCEAIERFEALRILPSDCRAQSERFSSERFTREFRAFIQSVIANDLDSESHTIEESAARFAATH